jgi:hypothetical protein
MKILQTFLLFLLLASPCFAYTINTATDEDTKQMSGDDKVNSQSGGLNMNINGFNYNIQTDDNNRDMGKDTYNPKTGEYIMDMGNGDTYNTQTGEYIIDLPEKLKKKPASK